MGVKAKYRYLQFHHDKPFTEEECNCEIVYTNPRTYRIKLLAHGVRGHKYGDVIQVLKSNVILPKEPRDCSNEFWNND